MKRLISFGTAVVLTVFLSWLAFVNHTEAYEVGIAWNFMEGELSIQDTGGYHITSPWTLVARIDTRPQRVCITSSSRTAFNCKLVRFESSAWREFIAVEGWRYYWLSNRISFNWSYREEYRGFRDVLRGYAFSAKQYPFIAILRDYDTP